MSIPNQPSVELPLLLELVRFGGKARRGETLLERLGRHFPDLTEDDKRLMRQNQSITVWAHTVDWARDRLHRKDEVNGGERGIWEITLKGKERLTRDLQRLGVAEPDRFIGSGRSLPEELGGAWKPEPLAFKSRSTAIPTPIQPPVAVRSPSLSTALQLQQVAPPRPLREGLLQRIESLKADEFERLVGELLKRMGMTEVRITQSSHDGGFDADCLMPSWNLKFAAQAKHYKRDASIGVDAVAAFAGRISSYDRGVFVTTAGFTAGAREVAEQHRGKIILIDGDTLVGLMEEHGLGITKKPVFKYEIDEGFFAGLGQGR